MRSNSLCWFSEDESNLNSFFNIKSKSFKVYPNYNLSLPYHLLLNSSIFIFNVFIKGRIPSSLNFSLVEKHILQQDKMSVKT